MAKGGEISFMKCFFLPIVDIEAGNVFQKEKSSNLNSLYYYQIVNATNINF